MVEMLPPEIVDEVTDLLDAVAEIKPYDTVKDAIIKRMGRSEEAMLTRLVK